MGLLRFCLVVIGIALGTLVFFYFSDGSTKNPSLHTNDVSETLRLAEKGVPDGEYRLGLLHMQGLGGVSCDPEEARKLYERAANKGHVEAQFVLATLYHRGIGISADGRMAAYWYRRAALGGEAKAQFEMGNMYEEDRVLSRDLRLAIMWYLKASQQGHDEAKNSLKRIRLNQKKESVGTTP